MIFIRNISIMLLVWAWAGMQVIQAQCIANANGANLSCFASNDGSIDLIASNGTGPYSFLWSNNQTTEDLSNLSAGTYTCTITDFLGCTTTASATLVQPSQIVVDLGGPVLLNCVNPVVPVIPSVSGGIPPYNYSWSTGETTANIITGQPGPFSLTVTDATGCTGVGNGMILADITPPVACAGFDLMLTCVLLSTNLDAGCSSSGPNFTFQWSGPGIVSGQGTLYPAVNAAGTYTLVVTNTATGCTATDDVLVLQDIVTPSVSAGPDLEIPCGGSVATLGGNGSTGTGFQYNWTTLDGNILSGANTLNPIVNEPGTYIVMVTNTNNGCTSSASMTVTGVGEFCSEIIGKVLIDTLQNCFSDLGEPGLAGVIVKAVAGGDTYFAITDANGDYQISVASGNTYSLSVVPLSVLWLNCPPIPNVAVLNPNVTIQAEDLLVQKLAGCPLLTVDLSSGNLRRCFSNNPFNVSYCNNGTEPAPDAFVIITLDPLLYIVSADLPYSDLGNGELRFEVGDLAVGQCGSFGFKALLACNATFGQTHCTEAHIYPDSSCLLPNAQWSGASLQISSECHSDSVHFTIKNVGIGDMPAPQDYIVIEDQVMLMGGSVQLEAGASMSVRVPANGSTWRLEMDQEPFHPGESRPAVSVEGCTTGPVFSTGFVTIFPADDADAFVDIDCRANTGSYDPNDKQGFPLGYGAQHYIRPGTPLEYQIRFQNTGNDTAFTVKVIDTLSTWLDPASIRVGASSHPYTWDLTGTGVLTFLFENILLPDSNVNEAASHGFVKFTIDHKTDAPLETLVENTAGIYFDFNDPIYTNTTFHRLGENFVTLGLWQPEKPEYSVLVSPNPITDAATLEIKGLQQNSPLHLQVFDLQGKLQFEMDSNGPRFQLNKGSLISGIYLFKVLQEGKNVGAGKLILR